MLQKNDKKEKLNIYEIAGKAGKVCKNCGGYVLAIGGTLIMSKVPGWIKKIKR